jgi:hypothetical protein
MEERKYGIFKLITGEEIISEFVTHDDNHLVLSNPVQVHRTIRRDGMPQFAVSHYMMFADSNHFKIKTDRIVALSPKIEDNALQHYLHFVDTRDEVISGDAKQQEEYYSKLEAKFEEMIQDYNFKELVPDANTTIH